MQDSEEMEAQREAEVAPMAQNQPPALAPMPISPAQQVGRVGTVGFDGAVWYGVVGGVVSCEVARCVLQTSCVL